MGNGGWHRPIQRFLVGMTWLNTFSATGSGLQSTLTPKVGDSGLSIKKNTSSSVQMTKGGTCTQHAPRPALWKSEARGLLLGSLCSSWGNVNMPEAEDNYILNRIVMIRNDM